jgi:phage terminase large subunit GpA-like protein
MPQKAEQLFPDVIMANLPAWAPPAWSDELLGVRAVVEFCGDELEALYRIARRPMSEWADEGGYVAIGAHGSDWSSEVTPHAAKIMDTWWQPSTREVVYCAVEQDGKTAIMYNCLGGSQEMSPGPAMVVMPTEKKATSVSSERLLPMFRNSRRLKRLLSPRTDDLTQYLLRLKNGGRVFLAWANSADALSSWPIKYLFFDETDKYPTFVGNETDPITLGERRVRTYDVDHKIFKGSTPSRDNGGYIYKELNSCPQIWVWHLRCTHCGDSFRAGGEHIDIPDGATLESIRAGEHHISLACPCCGGLMTNAERKLATRMGVWVCVKGADLKEPEKVGFHRRAYDCKDVSLSAIAIAKLRADSGDMAAKISHANGIDCIDYEEDHQDRKEDAVLRLCDERHAGDVHPESDILTIQIDTQDKGFWYTIRGWQYGPLLSSWLVKAGYVPSANADDFSALDQLIFDEVYTTAAGAEHRIAYGIIDSAGHRTAEVYAWCRRTGIFASKGAKGRKTQPVTVSKMEVFPGTSRHIPGGLLLYHLDTHYHKDLLNNKLQIEATDPGAFVLHSGYSSMQRALLNKAPELPLANGLLPYAKHFCAEYRDEKGLWQCATGADNHLWDCENMGIALAYYLGFHKKAREEQQADAHTPTSKPNSGLPSKPNWFNRRSG